MANKVIVVNDRLVTIGDKLRIESPVKEPDTASGTVVTRDGGIELGAGRKLKPGERWHFYRLEPVDGPLKERWIFHDEVEGLSRDEAVERCIKECG